MLPCVVVPDLKRNETIPLVAVVVVTRPFNNMAPKENVQTTWQRRPEKIERSEKGGYPRNRTNVVLDIERKHPLPSSLPTEKRRHDF